MTKILEIDSYDFEGLLKLRASYLKGENEEDQFEKDLDKKSFIEKLEELNQRYWILTRDVRNSYISEIRLNKSKYPDLDRKSNEILQNEEDIKYIYKLIAAQKYDKAFLKKMIRIIPMSLKEKSDEKDSVYDAFIDGRKKRIIKTVKFIKKDNPKLYEKHKSFFLKIIEYQYDSKVQEAQETTGGCTLLVGIFFIVYWIIKASL